MTASEQLPHEAPPAVDPRFQDPRVIRKIYGYAKTIAMVGLSPNRLRPSFFVGQYLQYRGYRVIPVNPTAPEILGETKGPKIRILKYKNKTGYKKRQGHRQRYTQVKITGIDQA